MSTHIKDFPFVVGPGAPRSGLDLGLLLRHAFTLGWQIMPPKNPDPVWWQAKSVLLGLLLIPALVAQILGLGQMEMAVASLAMVTAAVPLTQFCFLKGSRHSGKILALLACGLSFGIGVHTQISHLSGLTLLWPSPLILAIAGLICLSVLIATEVFLKQKNHLLEQSIEKNSFITSSLKCGDQVLIKAGDTIPRDGVIIQGMSSLDESPLTGVTRPSFKSPGETVYASTINRDSDILIEITGKPDENIINQLYNVRKTSLETRPPAEKKLQKYQQTLFWICLMLAAGLVSYRYFWSNQPLSESLAWSIPILFLAPLTMSVLYQILFSHTFNSSFIHRQIPRKASHLETLSRVGSVFFNKTGTLTKGQFVYSQAYIERGTNMGEFLSALFSLELLSDHPLAYAVETHPWHQEIQTVPVRGFQNHVGLGICGHVRLPGRKYECFSAAGNLRFVKRHRCNISRDMKSKADELEEMGETVILVAFDRQVRGLMSFSDLLRKDIGKVLRRLQKLGIETSLITGDTENTVTHVIGKLGIKKVYSRCTPAEKAARIEKERENGTAVAMVARDLDNLEALEKSDLSISFDAGVYFPHHQTDILILGRDINHLSSLFENAIIASRLIRSHFYLHATCFTAGTILTVLGFLPAIVALAGSAALSLGIYPFVWKYLFSDNAETPQTEAPAT